MKYIVLSATLNENIYKSYFGEQLEVYSYPEKKAAYEGKLIQYTYHSLGRRDLSEKKQVFSFVKNLLGTVNPEIITFKESRSIQGVGGMNTKNLHFGNQEPLLREIQMYGLESEMEQCVGRARLLRKRVRCMCVQRFRVSRRRFIWRII